MHPWRGSAERCPAGEIGGKVRAFPVQITVIGWPCSKIQRTLLNVRAAAADSEEHPEVDWISDIRTIAGMGAMTIPAVLVNGRMKLSGRIPSLYEIQTWIEESLEKEIAA
jgi:hypothetical protein